MNIRLTVMGALVVIAIAAAGLWWWAASRGLTNVPIGAPQGGDSGVACPADVRLCDDGSFVARTAPACDFAACPDGSAATATTLTVITPADADTTVPLSLHERFLVQFGSDLGWTIAFSPAAAVSRVPGSLTAGGYQGVYEADAPGAVTLTAAGKPICNPGEMCPDFITQTTVTLDISP